MSHFSTIILVLLTLQRSGSGILLHEAGHSYSTGLAVLLGEVLKQAVCFFVGVHQLRKEANLRLPLVDATARVKVLFVAQEYRESLHLFVAKVLTKEAWRILVPAALYVAQNNLYLYASGRLQPSTFQALWQLRLIPTAALSQIMLKREIGKCQWVALCAMLAGVMTIQQGQVADVAGADALSAHLHILAIFSLLLAAILASLAGVYLEKIFRKEETNLWIANFQLSSFSIVPATFILIADCAQSKSLLDPFKTFTHSLWPWCTVMIHGLAGILVALTTKYAGCIAGSISGIASIALTHLVELLLGANSSPVREASFFTGFLFVATSMAYYTYNSTANKQGQALLGVNGADDIIRSGSAHLLEMRAPSMLEKHTNSLLLRPSQDLGETPEEEVPMLLPATPAYNTFEEEQKPLPPSLIPPLIRD